MKVALNGSEVTLDCGPTEMLLDVLRRVGLSSVRETCRIGICGACTVLLDGVPITGCLTMAAQAHGRELTTVEGLSGTHPVQLAFIDAHAFQCGWCTPGFVLTAKRLLEETSDPSDQEITEALGGNLCRCGCYVEIAEAVRRAAVAMGEAGS